MDKLYKAILYFVAFCFCFGLGSIVGRSWEYKDLSNMEAINIANRVGVNPTWNDIRQYVYCDVMQIGKSRADIESELGKVGLYPTKEDDYIYSGNDFVHSEIGNLYARYDANNILTYKGKMFFSDVTSLSCP